MKRLVFLFVLALLAAVAAVSAMSLLLEQVAPHQRHGEEGEQAQGHLELEDGHGAPRRHSGDALGDAPEHGLEVQGRDQQHAQHRDPEERAPALRSRRLTAALDGASPPTRHGSGSGRDGGSSVLMPVSGGGAGGGGDGGAECAVGDSGPAAGAIGGVSDGPVADDEVGE